MAETPAKYTVGNIVAIIMTTLACVAMALHSFFGTHSTRFERSADFMGVFMSVGAVACGCAAVKAIRSRLR